MTNQEILERAITKAIDSGWKSVDMPDMVSFRVKQPTLRKGWPWFLMRQFNDNGQEVEVNIEHIIFNHDFARALWGEGGGGLSQGGTGKLGWDDHLKFMVIADDPIAYLAESLGIKAEN